MCAAGGQVVAVPFTSKMTEHVARGYMVAMDLSPEASFKNVRTS